jgi:hypothetical protein
MHVVTIDVPHLGNRTHLEVVLVDDDLTRVTEIGLHLEPRRTA